MPRPAIAIISNSQTPYRLHLHRRIAAELPGILLHSLYTHQVSNSDWEFEAPAEINPVLFGKGESSADQDRLSHLPRNWRRGGRVIRWLKEHDIRFVVMMGYNDIGRMRIVRWCRLHNIPCFMFGDSNIRGDNATGLRARVKQRVVGWVVRSCAGVLVCGSLGRDYFLKYGATADRIFYFPYEPDYDLIRHVPAEIIEQTREKLGLGNNRRRVVYSGRLMGHKRVDLLFSAFFSIAHQRPDWDLVVAGGGPDRSRLAAMVPVELARRVIWTGFVDNQTVVSAIYRLSDLLVLPSDFEPWALVINEAAAAGLAIVCSSVVGAAAELVQEGVNGRLFPPGDLPALIRALLEVTSPEAIDRMKQASPLILADWSIRSDPVKGLVLAMESVGVSSQDSAYRTDSPIAAN